LEWFDSRWNVWFFITPIAVTAEKSCQEDGHWYSKPGHSEWTNYSNCASSVIEVQKRRTYVHVTAYGVSIIAIIPALLVFFSYK